MLEMGREISFPIEANRQAYLVQIEGTSTINGVVLNARDAMEIKEENITILANELSHFLVIEMGKE